MKDFLTLKESKRLIELEKVIKQGKQTFVEVGLALAEIRDARLYKSDHDTFEAYCREKWGWGRHYANRLIEGASTVKSLGDNCHQIKTESQARELSKVEPDKREAVITKAAQTAEDEDRPMMARDVKAAAVEVCEPEPPRVQSLDEIRRQEAEEVFGEGELMPASRIRRMTKAWLAENFPHQNQLQWALPIIIKTLGAL